MADKRSVVVANCMVLLSGVISIFTMTIDALIAILLQSRLHQEMVTAQTTMKRNEFLCRAEHKFSLRSSRKPRSHWKKPGRTEKWWINLWQGQLMEEEWVNNLRMTRQVFMRLAEELRLYISPNPRSPNRSALSVEKKLALTLYYLKDMGSLAMTANSFGVAKSTVSFTVGQVCNAIAIYLGPKYIKLPQTEDEMRELVIKFESTHGFPQAFRCVDGTHIPIQQPLENSHDYFFI